MGKKATVPFIAAAPESGAVKKTQSREWMLLDARGESMVVEMDKYVIMRRFHIHARDLRILDPLLSYPSAILGREHAIVLNLEHIKAIITAEEVLLRNPSDGNVIPVVEELCRRLPRKHDGNLVDNGSTEGKGNGREQQKFRRASKSRTLGTHDIEDEPPFEFQALEVALEAICSFLDARTTELGSVAYPAFDELTAKISSRNLDRVRKLKTAMTRLTARVQKVRDELEQLLHDDGDMAELFLTRKLASLASPVHGRATPSVSVGSPSKFSRASRVSTGTGTYGADDDVEQVEMLLEAYFMQVDGTLNKLLALREYIDDTEDYINIQLDNHRNQLIQLELVLNAGTAVLAVYASMAGIFGMNVPYTWGNGYNYMFKWVVLVAGLISFIIFTLILSYARYRGLIGN